MKSTVKSLALGRKRRVRAKISGTTARPRLSIKISNRHIVAQIIDDSVGKTLAHAASATSKTSGSLTEKATWAGSEVATQAKKHKITRVVFDRGSHRYKKRLDALASAARDGGLEF